MRKLELSVIVYGRETKFLPLALIDIDNFLVARGIKAEIISLVSGVPEEMTAKLKDMFRGVSFSADALEKIRGERAVLIDAAKRFSKDEIGEIFDSTEEVVAGRLPPANFAIGLLSRALFVPEAVLGFAGIAGVKMEAFKTASRLLGANGELGRLVVLAALQKRIAVKAVLISRPLSRRREDLLNLAKAVKICFSKSGVRFATRAAPRTL